MYVTITKEKITLKYIFEICDPMIWDFWNESFLKTAI